MVELLIQLGYPARRETLGGILEALLGAKGLATERGWARLETVVARKRESNRRGFLLSRGFVAGDCVTYRWGMHEGRHQAPPVFSLAPHSSEMV
ncbi:MAG TPA: hypothetical protein VGT00_01065 [Methylomirabilota bacterium]|nr:hypothetical protein [Methylomirabilota bacterium]